MRLFFYGTLLDADVQSIVLGRVLARQDVIPAILRHFRCVYIAGRIYPMVVPQRGGVVEGVVAYRLSPEDLARIAIYEGDDYRCERYLVLPSACEGQPSLTTPAPLAAWLYRSRPNLRPSSREWRLASWQAAKKNSYLRTMEKTSQRNLGRGL